MSLFSWLRPDRRRDVAERYEGWQPARPTTTSNRSRRRGGDTMGRPDRNPTGRGEDFRAPDRGNGTTRRRGRRRG